MSVCVRVSVCVCDYNGVCVYAYVKVPFFKSCPMFLVVYFFGGGDGAGRGGWEVVNPLTHVSGATSSSSSLMRR